MRVASAGLLVVWSTRIEPGFINWIIPSFPNNKSSKSCGYPSIKNIKSHSSAISK